MDYTCAGFPVSCVPNLTITIEGTISIGTVGIFIARVCLLGTFVNIYGKKELSLLLIFSFYALIIKVIQTLNGWKCNYFIVKRCARCFCLIVNTDFQILPLVSSRLGLLWVVNRILLLISIEYSYIQVTSHECMTSGHYIPPLFLLEVCDRVYY